MKLERKASIAEHASVIDESYDFAIDTEQMSQMFQTYISGIYADKIGSFIREITTNGFDAHIEAGNTTDPVEVCYENDQITFRDYGIGLSKDRVKNIFTKLGASSKRDGNDQVGGFGIGAKSPLAYTESMWITTWYDDVKYTYLVHTNDGRPKMELLDSVDCPGERGTEIKISTKHGDRHAIINAVSTQLAYMHNVVYKGEVQHRNNIKILEGKTFRMLDDASRNNQYDFKKLHICLGGIYYPLPQILINGSNMLEHIPAALKFEVGELMPTVNRENIEQTDENLDTIKKRMREFKDELTERYEKMDIIKCSNFHEYLTHIRQDVYLPLPEGWSDIKVSWFYDGTIKPHLSYDKSILDKLVKPKTYNYGNSIWWTSNILDRFINMLFKGTSDCDYSPENLVGKVYRSQYENHNELNTYNIKVYYTEKNTLNGHKTRYLTNEGINRVTFKIPRKDTVFNILLDEYTAVLTYLDKEDKQVSKNDFCEFGYLLVKEFTKIVKEIGKNLDEVEVPDNYFKQKKKVVNEQELILHPIGYGGPTTKTVKKWQQHWKRSKYSEVIAIPYDERAAKMVDRMIRELPRIQFNAVAKSNWELAMEAGMIDCNEWIKTTRYKKLQYRINTRGYLLNQCSLTGIGDSKSFFKTYHRSKELMETLEALVANKNINARYREEYVMKWAKELCDKLVKFKKEVTSEILADYHHRRSLTPDELRVLSNHHKLLLADKSIYLKPIIKTTDEQEDHQSDKV